MSLENWQVAIAVLLAISIYIIITAAGTIRTMKQAGPPGSPQAALGQGVINSTIGCTAVIAVALAVASIIYLWARQPALPFPGVAVAFAPTPTPAVGKGRQAWIVIDDLVAVRKKEGYRNKSSDDVVMYTVRKDSGPRPVQIIDGPVYIDGLAWFKVAIEPHYTGWLPEFLPDDRRVLAP